MDTGDDESEIHEFGWWPEIAGAAGVALLGLVPDHLRPRQPLMCGASLFPLFQC